MLRLLLPVLMMTLFTGCIKYSEVEMLGIQDVNVKQFSMKGIKAEVALRVKNPNNYKIGIIGKDLDIYINGQNLGKADIKEKIVLPKKSDETHRFDVMAKFTGVGNVFSSLLTMMGSGSADMRLKGKIKASAKGISKNVDVDFSERVSL